MILIKSLDLKKMKVNRFLALLTAFIFLLGCSPQYHIEKASKHTKKALEKGAVISNLDTITTRDTIREVIFRNDTTYITNTIVRTVTEAGELRYITRVDKRREYKLEKQLNRLEAKNKRLNERLKAKKERIIVRTEAKTERAKNRSLWWLWLLLGFILSFALRFFTEWKKG